MDFKVSVLAKEKALEIRWCEELRAALRALQISEWTVSCYSQVPAAAEAAKLIFIDASLPELEKRVEEIDRAGKALMLVVRESSQWKKSYSELLDQGVVDDVIVHPFREAEIFSKLRTFHQILEWEAVQQLNTTFQGALAGLQEDVALAERLQKSSLPVRFPEVKGFQVQSRYLAGLRSGGDYMDLAESRDGRFLSVVMSDSSSYGLSSAVLSALMRITVKLSVDELRSVPETVRKVYSELLGPLREQDQLSLFYGVVDQSTQVLSYLKFGSLVALHAGHGKAFQALGGQGGPISRASRYSVGEAKIAEAKVQLAPEDRLVLISDGFVEAAGGLEEVLRLAEAYKAKSALEFVNELTFRVKRELKTEDEMPAQDCSVLWLDARPNVVQLKRAQGSNRT